MPFSDDLVDGTVDDAGAVPACTRRGWSVPGLSLQRFTQVVITNDII